MYSSLDDEPQRRKSQRGSVVAGLIFGDIGSLYSLSESGGDVLDENKPRASAGVGISWISPALRQSLPGEGLIFKAGHWIVSLDQSGAFLYKFP